MKNKKKTNLRTLTAILLSAACAFSSLPGTVLAAEETSTQAVKEILPTRENALTDEMKTGMGSIIYHVGSMGIWNDAWSTSVYSKNDITGMYQLADVGLGEDYSISDKFYRAYKDNTETYVGELRPRGNYTGWSKDEDGNITNGPDWGYQGFRLKYTWDFSNQTTVDAVPDKYWGNVMDISAYENTGYAVFEISSASGDLENAYLTLGSLRDIWAAGTNGSYGSDSGAITKATHPNIKSTEHFKTRLAGVKLTNYYDVEKGGAQNVVVPLSAFKTGDFQDVRWKAYSVSAEPDSASFAEEVEKWPLRLDRLHTWGITRLNSDTDDKAFAIKLESIGIVDLATPTNFTAVLNDDNSATMCWTDTTDTDVSYQVVRKYRNEVVYLDAGTDTTYTDTTGIVGRGYTYSVVAVDNTYGAKSAESNSVTLESTGVEEEWEDFALEDTWNSTEYVGDTTYETWPTPLAVGPYKTSDTVMNYDNDYAAHAVNGTINGNGRPRTYYIHDMYYNGTQDASITYRIQDETAEKYYASEIDQIWGFNGVVYRNSTNVPKYAKNFAEIQSSGYAIYDIKLEEGSSVDDAYLTIVYVCDTMQQWMNGYYWNLIGVPLKNYYDTTKSGYQQIAVPLSDFDINDEEVFGVFLDNNATTTGGRHTLDRKALSMEAFGGMGLLRLDSRGLEVYNIDTTNGIADALKGTAQPFAYTANQLALVNVESPANLKSTATADGVSLSWEPSTTTDVTSYEILRNDTVIGTVANAESYVDTTATPGFTYTYGVRAISPTYEGVYSTTIEVTESIPNGAVMKIFAGEGDSKYETPYAHDGTMSADFYAREDAIGVIANYDENGKLKGAASAAVTTGAWSTAVLNNCSKKDTIKAFLWDTDLAPLTQPLETTMKNLKILAIGNSFSQNATSRLHQIAAADGVDLDATNMYIGGCSLKTHWNNILGDIGAYEVWTNGSRVNSYGEIGKISEILESEEWDIITIQQASWESVNYASFEPYVTNITNYLHKTEPEADIIFHQTWEYGEEYGKSVFGDDYVGTEMCASILENSQNASGIISSITGNEQKIIPSGMAVREVLNTDPDYVVWSDGCHMSSNGCYLVGLVWYGALAGGDIKNSKYVHSSCTDEETAMFKECAQKAIDEYFYVTD